MIDIMFTEKYRPKKVSDIVGDFKDKILKYLDDPQSMPHMIFFSTAPGTGKSSLARAIARHLGADLLTMNSSEERGIDDVRGKIKDFVSTKSALNNMRRIVFLDECDAMTPQAQDALRNIMEYYSGNALFILTCNNIEKIIDPIRSRCLEVAFKYPPKQEIYKYLENICRLENMKYTQEGILAIMNRHYPNIRNCVLALQDLKTSEQDVVLENVKLFSEGYDKLWDLFKEKRWVDIKTEVFKNNLDGRELNMYFWERAISDDVPNMKLIQLCCRNERDMSYGADPKVIFVTSLIEMIK